MSKELPVGRKYLLMQRDPLVQKLNEKHKQWRKDCFNEILTEEVEQLKKQVREKWNAKIYWPETTLQGVTDYWLVTTPPYEAVEDARRGGKIIFQAKEENLNLEKMIFASFEKNGLIYCPPHKIPILIDPTILTLNDAQEVKKAVWEIVRPEIEKRKKIISDRDFPADLVDFLPASYIGQNETFKGRDLAVPAKEPSALAPILRCRPKTFEKYLRWYDWKIEKGLYFRLIALIEFYSKNPEEKEQKAEKCASKGKKRRNIGPVKEESAVRKGVGLIYQAIFRKSIPTKEDLISTLGTYNCPNHGRNCDIGCEYLNNYMIEADHKLPI